MQFLEIFLCSITVVAATFFALWSVHSQTRRHI